MIEKIDESQLEHGANVSVGIYSFSIADWFSDPA